VVRSAWRLCFASRFARTLACGLLLAALAAAWRFYPLSATLFARLVSPEQWGLFLRLLIRLFSGSTVLEFIAGPTTGSTALEVADLTFACLALAGGWGLVRVLQSDLAVRERCLAWAWAGMLASFYLIAGPAAIAPHAERYGVCLIAPGALLVARGLSYWLAARDPAARPTVARLGTIGLSAVAWLALGMFGWRYFGSIQHTGGESHRAFRTAAVEPKQAAWRQIVRESGNGPIWIVADEWWLYWPLAYLAAAHPEVRVVQRSDFAGPELTKTPTAAVWYVEFCNRRGATPREEQLIARHVKTRRSVISDYSGRPLLALIKAEPDISGNSQSRSFDTPGQ
jgi:hypothetical protein